MRKFDVDDIPFLQVEFGQTYIDFSVRIRSKLRRFGRS